MSFNSKQYLAYEERLLESGSVVVKGNHKWHQPVITQYAKISALPIDNRTESELTKMEDEYLKSKGI